MVFKIQKNKLLAPFTTFKVGGKAKYFVEVFSQEEIVKAINWAKEHGVKFFIFSGGSNILFPEERLNFLVIRVKNKKHSFLKIILRADAGCNLLDLIYISNKRGLGGWEKLAGIPGSIGGAIRGNAGAFGTEIKDILIKVLALNTETQKEKEFLKKECNFSYRSNFFKKNPKWIITQVFLKLHEVDVQKSDREIKDTIKEREKRHIQNVRAAGSYFINPKVPKKIQKMFEKEKGVKSYEGRVPAGWLIEKSGMKGARVGDALASFQHPNYILNTGNATSKNVLDLAENIKNSVKKNFGILLKEEVFIVKNK